MKKSEKLFYLLIFLLPVNLGKHFILYESYVRGLLVDYLIPTIYVQDIMVFFILLLWFIENKFKVDVFKKNLLVPYLFIFSLFFSLSFSLVESVPFIRVLLYFGLFIYVVNTRPVPKRIFKLFCSGMFLVSILGIFQYLHQGSIFNNYLLFGEQPYSVSTQGITLENIFGVTKVPAYGLFRHPNIFGGLLSILLIGVYTKIKVSKLYQLLFIVLFSALVLTFSVFSYISFVFGLLFLLFKPKKLLIILIALVIFLLSISLPFWKSNLIEVFSYTRRKALMESSYSLLKDNVAYGVGFNRITTVIENNLPYMGVVRFLQPVHNVFVLIFVESGIFSIVFFLLLVFITFLKTKEYLLLILLFQFVFLSCFDHYFWTIHQPHLLMWLLLGLCWTSGESYSYNK